MGSGSTTRNMCCGGRAHPGHVGGQPRHTQLSMGPWGLPSCPWASRREGQVVVIDMVSLQSALRCLSERSRLNIVSECPVLGGMQAEELRWVSALGKALCQWASAISWLPGRWWEPRGHHAMQKPPSLNLEPCPFPRPSSLATSSWAGQGLLR